MKRFFTALLAVLLIAGCALPAAAAHSEDKYLSGTLTLAGSGFDNVRTLTVAVLEELAETALGYENVYSMMTSGSVFTKHRFGGVRLYELLLNEGLDASLPDSTPVKFISKDGYTIVSTLGSVRGTRSRFSAKGGSLEASGLPAIIAFSSDGAPLVGPTGTESVYKKFTEQDGYVESADNIGDPLRLILGQSDALEFNAPNCAKWLAAVVVGESDGYVYSRSVEALPAGETEPVQTGDWTHRGTQADYRLKISGSEAKETVYLSLADLEAVTEGRVRQYFAASAGRNAYEGLALNRLVESCLADGVTVPSRVTVKAADGYAKQVDVTMLTRGVDSLYQPGVHRDVLLAWAVDGAPLVPGADSDGYNGANGFGPLRLVVENTISMWVKSVSEIVIGSENPFTDVSVSDECYAAALALSEKGIVNGVGGGRLAPGAALSRAQLAVMLWRLNGCPPEEETAADVWYSKAMRWAAAQGLLDGAGPDAPVTSAQLDAALRGDREPPAAGGAALTRAQAMVLLFAFLNR